MSEETTTTQAETRAPEEEEQVGVGRQCPYCEHWFHSTAFLQHMDEEFDMMNLVQHETSAAS